MRVVNLLASLPDALPNEVFETLFSGRDVRIERIISQGQCSPVGFWYNQPQTEWIVVLQGNPKLQIEGEEQARLLRPGDCLLLLPHVRHRVEWTSPDEPTVWLAVHVGE